MIIIAWIYLIIVWLGLGYFMACLLHNDGRGIIKKMHWSVWLLSSLGGPVSWYLGAFYVLFVELINK